MYKEIILKMKKIIILKVQEVLLLIESISSNPSIRELFHKA